jgi:cell filamentation protein
MASTEPGDADPYIDPATGLLANLVGASTQGDLAVAEADLVTARWVTLADQRIKPTGDLVELRAIHRHLFQDVYAWAGQLRTVDIRKNVEGGEFFVPVSIIERAAGFVAGELAEDHYLRGMVRGQFIARLAHHYDQLNYIHPFREGNGRAQRAFWDRVARDAGWRLSWLDVTGDVNDTASRTAAETRNLEPLIAMFDQIVTPL